MVENAPQPNNEPFLQVLANRTMLKVYILSIVHDPHLAEDVLSEVTLVVAKKWDTFDKERPFGPWARAIAKRVALAQLRKNKKNIITLDDDVLEAFGEQLSSVEEDEAAEEEKKDKLRNCLKKLPKIKYNLIQLRYFDRISYAKIAEMTGRSTEALYMAFSRIHRSLAECVKRAQS